MNKSIMSDSTHKMMKLTFTNMLYQGADYLKKFVNPISLYLAYISAFLALAMSVIVVVDIALRSFFNSPILGVIELETFLLVTLCFFSLSYTMIKRGHVRVDIFMGKIKGSFRNFLESLYSILTIFIFGFVGWEYIDKAFEAVHIGEIDPVLSWPLWPFYTITAFGCWLLCIAVLVELLKNYAKMINESSKPLILGLMVFVAAGAVIFSPALLKFVNINMDPMVFSVLAIIFLMVLLFAGMPVAFSMGLVGILGTWYLTDFEIGRSMIKLSVYDAVANYYFCVLPFFVFMGILFLKSGIADRLYRTGYRWFGSLPGGIAIATVFGCGSFAAICGDSMATAATMGSVAIPEMKKYDYDESLSTGSVAAGGTLGILIPPSIGFIIYGMLTEESVGKLFMAGIIPGIMLTTLFGIIILIRCTINPSLGPRGPKVPIIEKVKAIKDIWATALLFILVIGGIYSGLFTPTEAGGVGVVGALVIVLAGNRGSLKPILDSLLETTKITAMITAILIGVTLLGNFVTLTDLPLKLAEIVASLEVSKYIVFCLILGVYLLLGMLMNIIPMMMLTLPLIFPSIVALGFDPIWFGVIMVIMMEMGQITPPIGINVFVISGVTGESVPMGKIFKGIVPFIVAEVFVIIVLTLWPDIALYLPNSLDVLPSLGK